MSANGTIATTSLLITSDLRPGAIALGTIATISTTCVSLLFSNLLIGAFLSRRTGSHDERIFIRTHVGALVICLLSTDLIQGICGTMTLIWVRNGKVFTGTLCTTQAVLLHIANVGTALWNAVIAGHTYWTVVLGKRSTTLGITCVIASVWTTCFVLPLIGPFAIQTRENGPFYTISGVWCFVPNSYEVPRILLHYLPMLAAATVITVLYIQVALVLFGILLVDGSTWRLKVPTTNMSIRDIIRQFSWSRLHRPPGAAADQLIDASVGVSDGSQDRGRRNIPKSVGTTSNTPGMSVFDNGASSRPVQLKKLAVKMLWYPTAYLVLILPLTISRVGRSLNVSLDLLLAFTCLFLFMGTVNTLIYIYTRHLGYLPWSRSTSHSRSRGGRGQERTLTTGEISMQVYIERYTTRPVRDGQSIDLDRKQPAAGDTSSITSITPVVTSKAGEDFSRGYRESKVGFDFTGAKPTRHVLPTNYAGANAVAGTPERLITYPGYQEQYSQHPISPPRSLMRQQEQEQPDQTYPERRPYSV